MSETASLQIRDRGLKSTRVVALSGDHVRVGRSPICDVLLLDPKVARVECHLTRDGGRWTLTPERADGRVWFQGARLGGPLILEESVTFTVGENTLTFRSGEVAQVEPAPVPDPEPVPESFPVFRTPVMHSGHEPADVDELEEEEDVAPANLARRSEGTARTDRHQHLLQSRAETRKWESRWRAVGEKLKETSVASVSSPTVHRRPAVTPTEPPRAPVSRIVERPLPSASRVTREARPTPLHAHSPIPSPASRSEVSPPTPVSRPTYGTPRPASAPLISPYETRRPPVRVEPPSSFRAVERPLPTVTEPRFKTAVVETPPPVESRQAERVVESLLEFDDEENREYEAPPRRTLGATRRVSTSARRPIAKPEPQAYSSLIEAPEPLIESASEIGWNAEPVVDFPTFEIEPEIAPAIAETPVIAKIDEPLVPEALRSDDLALDAGHLQEPFVTDTFRDEPLVWQETTVASTPFEMIESDTSPQTSAEETSPFNSMGAGARQERFRRSHLDQEPTRGTRRDASSSQDWPSVSDIFINHSPRREEPASLRAKTKKAAAVRSRPEPTVSREPAQWTMPVWVGWFPATAASLFVLASLVGINWFWTVDNYHAGMIARRLDPKSGLTTPLPEGVEPGPTQWWRTSANHLLTWVRYLDRAENDPAKQAEARELLVKASEVSPLSPTVRHAAAIASGDPKEADRFALAKAVGQSRDILTLTHAGGQLLKAGKTESAREAYRMALEMASKTDVDQPISPVRDGGMVRRYSLPTEDLLVPVLRDMASQTNWNFADWESAIPRRTVAPLVAARVLQEMRHRDAKAALELARADAISETLIPEASRSENTISAVLLAAEAEALAMDDKLKESLECYREAIERMPIDRVARSWWLNRAEVARRLNLDSERRKALELAKCDDPKDEITAQAIELQKDAGDFIGQTTEKAKRDPETRAASTAVE